MSQKYIAYTRISTVKQITGASLFEQRRVITEYAERKNLEISEWYEEVESASKGNKRKIFNTIMSRLKRERNTGLIMHKIDRGARSLRDWANIGDLIDSGVDIKFAADDLMLGTRGGRLAADIQAVIAADYIRNLREEVLKGMLGRLHQGLYPFRAPRGYRNLGGDKVKRPDPIIAPLIIEAFKRYATGTYTLRRLAREMSVLGLLQFNDKVLCPQNLSKLLKCRFYVGEFKIMGKWYIGKHQPLVTRELFNKVQRLLKRRSGSRSRPQSFLYSQRLECKGCHYSLIAEKQKGHIYYRCHQCPKTSIREDRVLNEKDEEAAIFTMREAMHYQPTPYQKFDSLKGLNYLSKNLSQT